MSTVSDRPGELAAVTMLDEIHSTDGHRWQSTLVIGATVLVLVTALVWQESRGHHSTSSGPPVAGATSTLGAGAAARTVTTNPVISPCDVVQDCMGKDTYRLHLHVAVVFALPLGWSSTSYDGTSADLFSESKGYGVSVLEDVVAATDSSHPRADGGGGTDARSVALWLASRPFLAAGPVTSTRLSGLPAWQVDVRFQPGQRSVARCSRGGAHACIPLLLVDSQQPRSVGIWVSERIRWILVDLAGGGVTAVSTWDFTNRLDMLSPAQPLIDSIRFIEFR
jgi:hypothetical protein